jgi:hypothetical protein
MGFTIMANPAAKAVVCAVVIRMAADRWRSPTYSDTVAHRLLTACQERALTEDQTIELIEAALEARFTFSDRNVHEDAIGSHA